MGRLRLLREVGLRGTIAGAARSLGLTSSAVSQQLVVLEREAGHLSDEDLRRLIATRESIGQLKQILAEVIIIVLFVLFLRVALETYVSGAPDFDLTEVLGFLALPIAIVLLAAGLKMAQLHPKPTPHSTPQQGAAEILVGAKTQMDAHGSASGSDARP